MKRTKTAIRPTCSKTRIEAMNAERIIIRLARMVMRGGLGNLGKMARGETAAKAPNKKQLTRQAMRMMRRMGRI